MSGIALNDVHITYDGGGTAEEALREVPQIAGEYFEIGTPPAFGLFARNVRGLSLNGVRFETTKPDLRPAIVLDHVSDASLSSVSTVGNTQAKSLLRFVEAQEVLVAAPRLLAPAGVFLQVEGATSRDIRVENGDLSKAATPVVFAAGAAPSAAKVR
jgi:hypothetical protein